MKLRDHVLKLAEDIGATVNECRICPPNRACADLLEHWCHIPPIEDDQTYAVALHELGHIAVHPLEPSALAVDMSSATAFKQSVVRVLTMMMEQKVPAHILQREKDAWKWAEDHALKWTHEMEHAKLIGLASYEKRFATYLWR